MGIYLWCEAGGVTGVFSDTATCYEPDMVTPSAWANFDGPAITQVVNDWPAESVAAVVSMCESMDCTEFGYGGAGETAWPALTLEGGALIGAAILGLWATAWAFRQFMSQIEES